MYNKKSNVKGLKYNLLQELRQYIKNFSEDRKKKV